MGASHNMHRELGKVESWRFGKERHGIWTFDIEFKREVGNQVFGGYALCAPANPRRIGTAAGMDFVIGVCAALGVEDFSKLKGKTCWLLFEDKSWNSLIRGVQQLETDGNGLFLVSEWQKRWFPEQSK
jgi:hypothetical protein